MDKLLADVKRSAFTIPRFQRDFVWSIGQVKLLIDSIARNYPVGSLLFLAETDPANPFLNSKPINAFWHEESAGQIQIEQPNQFYVLDGQQRLTSIVRVFLQGSPDEVYYFDLKKLREFDKNPTKTDWIVKRKQNVKVTNKYLRSDVIIDRERCQVLVEEYFETNDEDMKGDRPSQRAASAKVNGIFETVRNYQIPYVVIDRSESLESICRIFETINSTGTRLTTFDLAVARFYPDPDLQGLWDDSRRDHEILKRYDVDGERVLQVIAMLGAVGTNNPVEATRTAVLNQRKPDVSDRWPEAVLRLVEAYEWAEGHGVAPGMFPNESMMVPLAVFLSQTDESWRRKQPGYSTILDKWYFASCLQQGARQASNYRVAEMTSELMRWKNDGQAPVPPKVNLTTAQIVKLRPTDSRYRTIMAFLRWRMNTDLWTDTPLDASDVDDHHIFPVVLAKRHNIDRQILDSVSNRILVSTATNRNILGERQPQDYLVKLIDEAKKNGLQKRKLELLKRTCIDLPSDRNQLIQSLDVSKAIEFIQSRAELILQDLETVLGDILVRSDIEDDD